MTLSRLALALSLALALHAFGQFPPIVPFAIAPPDPTSTDSVTLAVQQFASCPPAPIVVRSGFVIDVTETDGPCGAPPHPITFRVELGMLPAGHYTVNAHAPGGPVQSLLAFDVFPAAPLDLSVSQPVGTTAGGTTVIVSVPAAFCLGVPSNQCPLPSITFGGVPATNIAAVDDTHFRVTTPAHAAGPVQVVASAASYTKSSYAFRYYDPQAAPSEKFFERVLIPVIFHGPGAFGSNWVTELSLVNDNSYPIEAWRPIAGRASIDSKPVVFGSEDAPNGLFLVVPRQADSSLTFHAAVRDTSRADREWATEIPVVREEKFSIYPVELLDIPIDPRFRTMVRIYSPDALVPDYARQLHISVYSLDDGHVLRELFSSLTNPSGCSDAVSCAEHPAFASVSDLTNGLPSGRAGIRIEGSAPLWAFATVTNNDTQHVTVVSPQ